MGDRLRVYVFDGSEADLRGRTSQIEAAQLGARWEVVATSSRNQLLSWIERDATTSPKRQSVALIDYRTESGDIEQLGFRLVELIRRHAYLWKATRPAIWVDHLSAENVQYAHAVAAEAIVDDEWVDRDPRSALAQVFEWCSGRPRRPVSPGHGAHEGLRRRGEPARAAADSSGATRSSAGRSGSRRTSSTT